MNNTLIIFDCFGVIFEDIAPPFLRKHLPEGEADCIKEKLFNPADLGEVSYGELLKNMSEALSMDYEKMVEEWNSMFILKKDTVDYIRKIKDKADVVLLSNAPESVVENLFEKHGIEDLFLELFVSYKLGIAKLDPKEKLHVSCAVDLRRYLKDINSIGYTNHTTFMLCSVDSMGETMDDTVKMARDSTNKAKTDEFLGLHGLPLLNIAYKTMVYAQAELVVKLFYNNANLAISNVGTIAGRLYVMDGHAPLAAFGSGGAKRKPSGFTTTQSIGGRLNLIMAVIGNDEDEKMVIRFFDMIEEEMKEYIA